MLRNSRYIAVYVTKLHRPALGTMRLIARKILYIRCVGQCLQSQCHFCVAGQDLQLVGSIYMYMVPSFALGALINY